MTETKQAQDFFADMLSSWTDTQKKLLETWTSAAQNSTANFGKQQNAAKSWQNLASQGFGDWLGNAEPTAQATSQRLLESQAMLTNLINFFMKGWSEVMQQGMAGGDWQKAMQNYVENFRQQLTAQQTQWAGLSQTTGELWTSYLQQVPQFVEPWQKVWQSSLGLAKEAPQDSTLLGDLANLNWQAFQKTFGQYLQTPALGMNREYDEKLRQGFHKWMAHEEAKYEYQLVIGDAWLHIMEVLQAKFTSLAEEGKTITTLNELISIWNETADPAFLDVFRSDKYIKAQGKMVNTMMAYRLQKREFVEALCEQYDLPTRTEVDEAHRRNYQQGRAIKALQKDLAETRALVAELHAALGQAPKAPSTRKKTTTKSNTEK